MNGMDGLLPFYERELGLLRDHLQELAQRHPGTASRLAIAPGSGQSDDPHVEQLVQSAAWLAAGISRKLDDDYAPFTEALIGLLSPHYPRPFPACSIAWFDHPGLDQLAEPMTVRRGTGLASHPIGGSRGAKCRFTTTGDVTLAPLRVARVAFSPSAHAPAGVSLPRDAVCSLSITLEVLGRLVSFDALGLGTLRLFVDAQPALAAALMDALFMQTAAVFVEPLEGGRWMAPAHPVLREVGFSDAEAMLWQPAHREGAYRLLSEYFACPEKFNFIDLDLGEVARTAGACRALTVHVVTRGPPAESATARLLEGVTCENLRPGCVPVINLHAIEGEPFKPTHAAAYPVVGDAHRSAATEVYSIDKVQLLTRPAGTVPPVDVHPLHSLKHAHPGAVSDRATPYWVTCPADLGPGAGPAIRFVDEECKPVLPQAKGIRLALTCTNGTLPQRLKIGQPRGDLVLVGNASGMAVRLLRQPGPPLPPARGNRAQWHIAAHLVAHPMSLMSGTLPALKAALRLYRLSRSSTANRQIEALTGLEGQVSTRWMPGQPAAAVVRGHDIRLTIDPEGFAGSSLYVFARVLDHFFALHVHQNSFTQLAVFSAQDGRCLIHCEPRSGRAPLL